MLYRPNEGRTVPMKRNIGISVDAQSATNCLVERVIRWALVVLIALPFISPAQPQSAKLHRDERLSHAQAIRALREGQTKDIRQGQLLTEYVKQNQETLRFLLQGVPRATRAAIEASTQEHSVLGAYLIEIQERILDERAMRGILEDQADQQVRGAVEVLGRYDPGFTDPNSTPVAALINTIREGNERLYRTSPYLYSETLASSLKAEHIWGVLDPNYSVVHIGDRAGEIHQGLRVRYIGVTAPIRQAMYNTQGDVRRVLLGPGREVAPPWEPVGTRERQSFYADPGLWDERKELCPAEGRMFLLGHMNATTYNAGILSFRRALRDVGSEIYALNEQITCWDVDSEAVTDQWDAGKYRLTLAKRYLSGLERIDGLISYLREHCIAQIGSLSLEAGVLCQYKHEVDFRSQKMWLTDAQDWLSKAEELSLYPCADAPRLVCGQRDVSNFTRERLGDHRRSVIRNLGLDGRAAAGAQKQIDELILEAQRLTSTQQRAMADVLEESVRGEFEAVQEIRERAEAWEARIVQQYREELRRTCKPLMVFVGGLSDRSTDLVRSMADHRIRSAVERGELSVAYGSLESLRAVGDAMTGWTIAYFDHGQQEELFQKIDRYIADRPDAPVFLVGHSWGGATAMEVARRLAEEGHAGANMYVITLDAYDGPEFREAGGSMEKPMSVKYWANVYALRRGLRLKVASGASSLFDYMTLGIFDLQRSVPWGYQPHANENVRFDGFHSAAYGMFRAVQGHIDLSEPWEQCLADR